MESKNELLEKLKAAKLAGKIGGGAIGDKLQEISEKFVELAERLDQIIADSTEKIVALKKLVAAWEAFKEMIDRDEGIGGGGGVGDGGGIVEGQ
jgi:hypothetical protein